MESNQTANCFRKEIAFTSSATFTSFFSNHVADMFTTLARVRTPSFVEIRFKTNRTTTVLLATHVVIS